MIKGLEAQYENYVNGPYMVEVDKCDVCFIKRIVLVIQDKIEFEIDGVVYQRRLRFCTICMGNIIM